MSPPLDTIDILINGQEVLNAKEYDIVFAYFTAPSTASVTLGSGKTSLDLMRTCQPGFTAALRVNGIVQFVGFIDGFERIGGGATEVTFSVRDGMQQLVRAHVENERTFNNATFEQLANAAIQDSGVPEYTLFTDVTAQRSAVAGTPIVDQAVVSKTFTSGQVFGESTHQEIAVVSTGETAGTPFAQDVVTVRQGVTTVSTTQTKTVARIKGYKAEKPIKWEVGETYFQAFKKEGDRGGIFLRAGVDPDGNDPWIFQVGAPDGAQPAKFWLLNTRREVAPDNAVLVLPPQIKYVMTGRHSDYVVYGQAGGGKDGRKPIVGRFHDPEAAAGLPLPATWVHKDTHCKNTRQANFLARKQCAAERRANRSFVYTIPHRHTVPLIDSPTTRIVPVPDLVAHIRDDEHGMNGPMWVEKVRHHKSATGGTFTEITLIDPTDLVFGEDEPGFPVPQRTAARHHRRA